MAELVGPVLPADVLAALTERYPHNDIRQTDTGYVVTVPGGVIVIDNETINTDIVEANTNVNTGELSTYIDELPILVSTDIPAS